jgi:hypothetical protein
MLSGQVPFAPSDPLISAEQAKEAHINRISRDHNGRNHIPTITKDFHAFPSLLDSECPPSWKLEKIISEQSLLRYLLTLLACLERAAGPAGPTAPDLAFSATDCLLINVGTARTKVVMRELGIFHQINDLNSVMASEVLFA